jgi:hypothetical protein
MINLYAPGLLPIQPKDNQLPALTVTALKVLGTNVVFIMNLLASQPRQPIQVIGK